MKKILTRLSNIALVMAGIFTLSLFIAVSSVEATETSQNPLLEGLEIAGPEHVYVFEKTASFSLQKDGYAVDQYNEKEVLDDPYYNLHYEWSSSNSEVAEFYETELFFLHGCIGGIYPALDRPNIFNVKSGETDINCTISDDEGNSITISKHLTVIEETPIKSLQLGNIALGKDALNSNKGIVYSNYKAKNLKLSLTLEDGWKLTSDSTVSIDSSDDYTIVIKVKNDSLNREFTYRLYIYRYTEHTIDLSDIEEGGGLVRKIMGAAPMSYEMANYISYWKGSGEYDTTTFNSVEDLVKKLQRFYNHDKETVSCKDGKFVYKETSKNPKWIYCKNKMSLDNVVATAGSKNSLFYGLDIDGPDYIYEMEGTAKFTLKKDDYPSGNIFDINSDEEVAYRGLTYEWWSDNKNVAGFVETFDKRLRKLSVVEMYPALHRINVFNVKAGTATIYCKISDKSGNSVILSKKLTVLEGTPLKSVKIGKHKIKKAQRNVNQAYIYSNEKGKKTNINITPKQGWKVKYIGVDRNQSGIYKDITEKKYFSLKTSRDVYLKITLENEETGQIFEYKCDIVRYKKHKIKLGKLKKGYALVSDRVAWNVSTVPQHPVVLKYKKKSKKTDSTTFKSGKDLVRKLKKYYGYTNQTVKFKKGKLIYKETGTLEPWIYCKSKSKLKKTLKKFKQ